MKLQRRELINDQEFDELMSKFPEKDPLRLAFAAEREQGHLCRPRFMGGFTAEGRSAPPPMVIHPEKHGEYIAGAVRASKLVREARGY